MDIFNLLFSYEGRINRAKFWLAVLAYIILSVVIVMLLVVPIVGWIAAAAGYIAMLVSGIMVGIKRLHDRAKSGWWIVLFIVGPMLLSGAGVWINHRLDEDMTSGAMVLSFASFAISLWGFIELGCLRGTVGPNPYGADPLNQAA